MRDEDRVRLLHMIEASESLAQFVAGRSRDDLDGDRMLRERLIGRVQPMSQPA